MMASAATCETEADGMDSFGRELWWIRVGGEESRAWGRRESSRKRSCMFHICRVVPSICARRDLLDGLGPRTQPRPGLVQIPAAICRSTAAPLQLLLDRLVMVLVNGVAHCVQCQHIRVVCRLVDWDARVSCIVLSGSQSDMTRSPSPSKLEKVEKKEVSLTMRRRKQYERCQRPRQ